MSIGYTKTHRRVQGHWLWNDKPFARGQAFLDLVLLASHENTRFLLGNRRIQLQRGQLLNSLDQLAFRWGWGEKKTRNFIDLLVEEGMIVKASTAHYTVITIRNYDKWQGDGTGRENAPPEGRTEAGPGPEAGSQKSLRPSAGMTESQEIRGGQKPDTGMEKGAQKADIQETQEEQERKEIKKKEKENEQKRVALEAQENVALEKQENVIVKEQEKVVPEEDDSVPYKFMVDLYHSACPSLPRILKLTPDRKQLIADRWREYGREMGPFIQLFHTAQASAFLTGGNGRSWRASLDWLLKAGNMTKTLEGKYSKGGMTYGHHEQPAGPDDPYTGIVIDLDQLDL